MNEEYIPTFEVVETKDEYGLLKRLDDFEDQIKLAKEINDKYENMKKDIKKKMVEIGKEKNATQIKWITPKGTQINVGKCVEQRELQYTVGGNVSWYSHYGEKYGGSFKN